MSFMSCVACVACVASVWKLLSYTDALDHVLKLHNYKRASRSMLRQVFLRLLGEAKNLQKHCKVSSKSPSVPRSSFDKLTHVFPRSSWKKQGNASYFNYSLGRSSPKNEPLGASWGPLGSLLGASCEPLGDLSMNLGNLLETSWGLLGRPVLLLGRS